MPPDAGGRNRQQGLTSATLRGAGWSLSGTGVEAFLQLLVLAILARLVSPEAFGLVSAAVVILHFSSIFVDLGVGPAIVQRPNLEPRHLMTAFGLTLVLGVACMALLQAAAPSIAGLFRMEGLTPVLRVISLVFLVRSVAVVAEKLLQRELRFRLLATVGVVSYGIGYGIVGVTLALLGLGVWALVAAYLAQAVCATIAYLVTSPHPKGLWMQRAAAAELLNFGGGFTLARIFNQLAIEGDNFVVGRWLGAEALGIYGRAYQLMTMPAVLFGKSLDKVLFPAMAKVQHQKELLALVFRRGVALIALIVLPASLVLCVLAPEVVAVLLGPQWTGVVVPLQILALAMLFRTSYKMSDSLARATGAVYRRAWRQMVYALSVIGGAWIGHHWGVAGVTAAVLAALALNFLLMAHLSLSLTGMSWTAFLGIHLRFGLVAAAVGSASWLTAGLLRDAGTQPLLVLVLTSATAVLVYLFLVRVAARFALGEDGMWMLRTLTRQLPERFRLLVPQAVWMKP